MDPHYFYLQSQFYEPQSKMLRSVIVAVILLLALCERGTSWERNTDWLLRHCTEGGLTSETTCFTQKLDPVSCIPIGSVRNCEKASASFSHVRTLQISPLTHESLAIDENREHLCFKSLVRFSGTNDPMGNLLGIEIQVEQLESDKLHGTLYKFGCMYPKGIENSNHPSMPYCCKRLPQAFFEDESRISVSAHSLPVMPALLPESGTFQLKNLTTLKLANFRANFVDVLLPNIDLEATEGEPDFPVLKFGLLLAGVSLLLLLIFLGVILLIWRYCCRKDNARADEDQGRESNQAVMTVCGKYRHPPESVALFYNNAGERLELSREATHSEDANV